MDFARKQLEKYGWTDGKGLGKHENGISQALKPKLKRSVAGIGHDAASEYNEHWWTALYDKAAGNIEVKEKNNKTKKIKARNYFEITNSTWKLKNNKKKSNEKYSDNFIRTAVLTNGVSKMDNVSEHDETVDRESEKKDVFQMTDEELFKACEGRTAHKGARHGLKAIGKLARIAQQEEMLLAQPQYNGYSHSKKKYKEIVENVSLMSEKEVKNKKKKKKRCPSNNNDANGHMSKELVENKNRDVYNVASDKNEISNKSEEENVGSDCGRKIKKSKKYNEEVEFQENNQKKKKRKIVENYNELDSDRQEENVIVKKKKKK